MEVGDVVGSLKDNDGLSRAERGVEDLADVRRAFPGECDCLGPLDRVESDRAKEFEQPLAGELVASVNHEHLAGVDGGFLHEQECDPRRRQFRWRRAALLIRPGQGGWVGTRYSAEEAAIRGRERAS